MEMHKGKEALALSTLGRINVIYGYTGSGKSSLALSATKNNKVLFIDVENSVGKIWDKIPEEEKNLENLTTASVDSVSEFINFLLSDEARQFDIITIDSITFLAEQELGAITDAGKSLTFNHYGDLGIKIKQVLRQAQLRGLNINILMQAERIETSEGRTLFFPRAAGKQIAPAVVDRADNIIYITREEGSRVGYTTESLRWHAKQRDPLPEQIEEKDLYYSKLEKHFAKYDMLKADKNELKKLMIAADVTQKEKLYKRIGWDPKEEFCDHHLREAKKLLSKVIEANEAKQATKLLEEGTASN